MSVNFSHLSLCISCQECKSQTAYSISVSNLATSIKRSNMLYKPWPNSTKECNHQSPASPHFPLCPAEGEAAAVCELFNEPMFYTDQSEPEQHLSEKVILLDNNAFVKPITAG